MAAKLTFVERVWTKQPSSVVGIDWSNPASNRLLSVLSGNGLQQLYGTTKFTRYGTLTNNVTSNGLGLHFNGGSDVITNYIGAGNFSSYSNATNEITIVVSFVVDDFLLDDQKGLFNLGADDGGAGLYAYIDVDAHLKVASGTWNGDILTPKAIVFRKPYTLVLSAIRSGKSFAYLNGEYLGSDSAASTSWGDSITEFGRGFAGLYGDSLIGSIQHIQVNAKALPEHLCRSLSVNPWQIFEPEQLPLFKPEGTGPVTHPSTGDVVGNTATVSGTALRYRAHPTTGVVTGLTSVVAGAAENAPTAGIHEADGVVTGTTGAITGSALHIGVHRTTGIVAGYQGAVTGTAKNYTVHETTGVLSGFSAEVIGTAQRAGAVIVHSTSGALAGYDSVVNGAATNMGSMTLTPADIQAIVAALKAEILPVNIVRVNGGNVDGDGSDNNPWGPV